MEVDSHWPVPLLRMPLPSQIKTGDNVSVTVVSHLPVSALRTPVSQVGVESMVERNSHWPESGLRVPV